MNKILKSILCAGVCATMLLAAGCNNNSGPNNNDPNPGPTEKRLNSETRVLRLSTGALDKNFNPFFYTAQNDGNMIANTQIGMLTVDEGGNLVAGQNYPTAVLDFKETMYTTRQQNTGSVTPTGSMEGRTEYEYVIKNGIKFSNGDDLTIADVLFNLYVYLDPSYTGSNTIYSTDIQGLKAYRAQNPLIEDDYTGNTDSGFTDLARARIRALTSWSADSTETLDEKGQADLEKVKTELRRELDTHWNSVYSSWSETYKETNNFEYAWQAYLYEEGLVVDQMRRNPNGSVSRYYNDVNGNGVRDDGEKYYTTLDEWQTGNSENGRPGTRGAQHLIDEIEEAKASASGENDEEEKIKEKCIELAFDNASGREDIGEVLLYRATGNTIFELFTNEERSNHFETIPESERVKSISGISSYTKNGAELNAEFNGKMGEAFDNGQTYSVLKIVINGVDPKAKYNFSYSVSPLGYYSTHSYKGKDYIAEALAGEGFGLQVGDTDFFQDVLQAPEKVMLPIGAGPYKAADLNGNPTDNGNRFVDGTIVSFVRNENFTTLGSGVNNAKIKNVQYKELQDDQIMSSLSTDSIDFGMPNATPTTISEVSSHPEMLASQNYDTGGYGYIGINPKSVPEVYVRQAIMKAMNTSTTVSFYGSEYASRIYRPMTITSWAYPKGVSEYEDIAYELNNESGNNAITALVQRAGYELRNGVFTKVRQIPNIGNARNGDTLKLSFTIAGETTNHPAYRMFCDTRDRLNALGFDINVKTSTTALQDLAAGNLAVWAAAWSSAIDPDPYQTYHKDSRASSVLNWNYPNILNNQADWDYEYGIIEELSAKIDEGRQSNSENIRTGIYHECLDMIMSLAVELPTYQRRDLCVYNINVINPNTLVKNPSFNMGLFDKLWEIDYV